MQSVTFIVMHFVK